MSLKQLGPFKLIQQIATGGMAEIYLAATRTTEQQEKLLCLKVLLAELAQDHAFIEMLIDEARIAVDLEHPNIVQTFDLGRDAQTYYIVMEYIEGVNLFTVLQQLSQHNRSLTIELAAYIAREVCNGLTYAHHKCNRLGQPLQIIHRDISPQNILLSVKGEVKIVDFGIAKAASRMTKTQIGMIKGKYCYMSPEQARGKKLDQRTDIFSTGILLYEMLTGQMLYLEEDTHRLLQRVRGADVPPPKQLRPDVPSELTEIVMRALAPQVTERWPSADAMKGALTTFLLGFAPKFSANTLAQLINEQLSDHHQSHSAEEKQNLASADNAEKHNRRQPENASPTNNQAKPQSAKYGSARHITDRTIQTGQTGQTSNASSVAGEFRTEQNERLSQAQPLAQLNKPAAVGHDSNFAPDSNREATRKLRGPEIKNDAFTRDLKPQLMSRVDFVPKPEHSAIFRSSPQQPISTESSQQRGSAPHTARSSSHPQPSSARASSHSLPSSSRASQPSSSARASQLSSSARASQPSPSSHASRASSSAHAFQSSSSAQSSQSSSARSPQPSPSAHASQLSSSARAFQPSSSARASQPQISPPQSLDSDSSALVQELAINQTPFAKQQSHHTQQRNPSHHNKKFILVLLGMFVLSLVVIIVIWGKLFGAQQLVTLEIHSQPAAAQVVLNGTVLKPKTPLAIQLKDKKRVYTVELRLKNYQHWQTTVNFEQGKQHQQIVAKLLPKGSTQSVD